MGAAMWGIQDAGERRRRSVRRSRRRVAKWGMEIEMEGEMVRRGAESQAAWDVT